MTTPLTMPGRRTLAATAPTNDVITEISILEQRVAESGRRLETAAQRHHRYVSRLAVLRQHIGLTAQPVPEVEALATADIPDGWFAGRIIRRERLTADSKTGGSIRLAAGRTVEWTAGAFYVDTLEPLFSGLPVIVTGKFKDRVLSISAIKPAPLSYWNDDERSQYETAQGYDSPYIQRIVNARTALMTHYKSRCRDCSEQMSKPSKASLIRHANGYRLVCRPCKQAWIDAGRPPVTG